MPSTLIQRTKRFAEEVGRGCVFSAPVTHVYNPLQYAWSLHHAYLERYGKGRKKIIFLGMNPGPFGMVQTGVPFGEVNAVKNLLHIQGAIETPAQTSPYRPIEGLACKRSEVSGRRLWGFFIDYFKTADVFLNDHFVFNYCPLAFLDKTRNITPDKIAADEILPILNQCDDYLRDVIEIFEPEWLVGVGKYARKKAEAALSKKFPTLKYADILHPSPASPLANKDWPGQVLKQLYAQHVWSESPSSGEFV